MRPDPQDASGDGDADRIIYLGDVRRRRHARNRRAPDRHYLAAIGLATAAAWAVWLTVLFSLQPSRFLTYLAFLFPLAVALTGTGALISYAVESKLDRLPGLRQSIRHGAWFALIVVLNLASMGGHLWSPVVLGASILVVLVAEALIVQRGR